MFKNTNEVHVMLFGHGVTMTTQGVTYNLTGAMPKVVRKKKAGWGGGGLQSQSGKPPVKELPFPL